jgi:serine protease Do
MMIRHRLLGIAVAVTLAAGVHAAIAAPSDDEAIADVVARVQPSVVRIIAVQPRPKPPPADQNLARAATTTDTAPTTAIGSGFVVDASGLIATNHHVVNNAVAIFVGTPDGGRYRAEVVGMPGKVDVALLRIASGPKLKALAFGDSDKLRAGDTVIAIGSPFGFDNTVTHGIVSAVNRDIMESPFDEYIQTDAPINHGNSGGPLFNMAGEVVGMNSVLFAPGTETGSVGLGFSIPSNELQFIIGRLEKYGEVRAGMLPIRTQPLTGLLAEAIDVPDVGGVLVAAMSQDGSQLQSNIHPGDVIRSFNQEAVIDPRDLARKAAAAEIGSTVTLGLYRSGAMIKVAETIMPVEARKQPSAAPTLPKIIGLQFTAAPKAASGQTEGVMLESVDPSGSAADSGLRKGDIITRVLQQEVNTPEQALAALQARSATNHPYAAVLVRRDDKETWIPIALPN